MPPKAKLHNKNGKVKSFPKSVVSNIPRPSTSADNLNVAEQTADDNERKFEVELCWCIQQLEITLENKNLNPKLAEESMKVLKVLKNNGQPTVRKRQLMRQHFGDYRSKMVAEEKKAKKANNKISFTSPSTSGSKFTFIRKSSFLTTGDNSFRFNFSEQPQASEADCIASDNTDGVANGDNSSNNDKSNNEDVTKNKKNYFSGGTFKFNFNID